MTKILHYLNQFFAGIGGEDKAGQEFLFVPKPVGPGVVLCDLLKNQEVECATVVCGDNYFHENEEAVLASLTEVMTGFAPDLFIAGPAFHAGRYGIACAKTASFVRERWNIPAVTGLYEENPGTREIGRHVLVIQTGSSAASMQATIKRFADLSALLLKKDFENVERFKEEYCLRIPRRFTVQAAAPDSVRAVEMLLAKLRSFPCDTSYRYGRRFGAERQSRPAGELARNEVLQVFDQRARRFKTRRVRSHAHRLRYLHSQCRSRQTYSSRRHAEIGAGRELRQAP